MSDVDDLLAEIEGTLASQTIGSRSATSTQPAARSAAGAAVSSSASTRSASSGLTPTTSLISAAQWGRPLASTSSAVAASVVKNNGSSGAHASSKAKSSGPADDLLDELLDMTSDSSGPGKRPAVHAASSSSVGPSGLTRPAPPYQYNGKPSSSSGAGAGAMPSARSESEYSSSKWDDEEEEGGAEGESKYADDCDDDDHHHHHASGSSRTSNIGSAGGGKCTSLCLAPDSLSSGLGSCEPGVYRPGLPRRYCDRLQCADCDFAVLRFNGGVWATTENGSGGGGGIEAEEEISSSGAGGGVSYMFFRNHVPDRDKLKQRLLRAEGCASYCCQCSWVSLTPADNVLTVKKAATGITMPVPAGGGQLPTGGIVGGNGWAAWFCAGH